MSTHKLEIEENIIIEYEYFKEQKQTYDDPYLPDCVEIINVYIGGVECYDYIDPKICKQWEVMCLEQHDYEV